MFLFRRVVFGSIIITQYSMICHIGLQILAPLPMSHLQWLLMLVAHVMHDGQCILLGVSVKAFEMRYMILKSSDIERIRKG